MERRIPIRRHLSVRRKATKPGHVRAPQTRRRIGIRLSIAPLAQKKKEWLSQSLLVVILNQSIIFCFHSVCVFSSSLPCVFHRGESGELVTIVNEHFLEALASKEDAALDSAEGGVHFFGDFVIFVTFNVH